MKTNWRHEVNVKYLGIITAAVIGAGAAWYSVNEAKIAANKARDERANLKKIEDDRLAAIERDTKPTEESATVEFGQEDTGEASAGYEDFLIEKTNKSALGSSASGSGLSSGNLGSLGFGA